MTTLIIKNLEIRIKKNMQLVRFDFIDQNGNLNLNKKIEEFSIKTNKNHCCGIYTFHKK